MNGNCCFGNGPLRVCGYLAVTGAKGLQGFSTVGKSTGVITPVQLPTSN